MPRLKVIDSKGALLRSELAAIRAEDAAERAEEIAIGVDVPGGIATLDESGKLKPSQVPSPETIGEYGVATLDANGLLTQKPNLIVNSVTELRSLEGKEGIVVTLHGYHEGSNRGGGVFYWSATDPYGLGDDSGVVFYANGDATGVSGYWVRLENGNYDSSWFDVKNDGTETLTEFNKLVTSAANRNKGIIFETGSTIKLDPGTTIDLSGIPYLDGTNVTIDMSESGIAIAFEVLGSKTLIDSNVAITQGVYSVTINPGLDINRGDKLLVTSIEKASPGLSIAYYYKGERWYVESYDSVTGELIIGSYTRYDYSNAYIWKVNEHNIEIGSGITFVGPTATASRVGLRLGLCNATVNAHFRNWVGTAIQIFASEVKVGGTIRSGMYEGTETSYGVAVCDLSLVTVEAQISAGRHAISTGGGTFFTAQESGADPSSPSAAVYPCSLFVPSGEYESSPTFPVGTIGGHANTEEIYIGAAVKLRGGLYAHGRITRIHGAHITFKDFPGFLSQLNDTEWGDVELHGVRFESEGTATWPGIYFTGATKRISIKDCSITGKWSDPAEALHKPIYINANTPELYIDGLEVHNQERDTARFSSINIWTDPIRMNGLIFRGSELYITPQTNNLNVILSNSVFTGSSMGGVRLHGNLTNKFNRVYLDNVKADDNGWSGIYAKTVKRLTQRNGSCNRNGLLWEVGMDHDQHVGIMIINGGIYDVSGTEFIDDSDTPTQWGAIRWTSVHPDVSVPELRYDSIDMTGCSYIGLNIGSSVSPTLVTKRNYGNIDRDGTRIEDYIQGSDGNMYVFDGANWSLV